MKVFFLFLIIFSEYAFSQFNKSDISDLKADLTNYANSKCEDDRYLKSAMNIMDKLSTPLSNGMTSEQAKANNLLRDALSGVREALIPAVLGNKAGCAQKLTEGIKKLDSLPVQPNAGSPVVSPKDSSGVSR